MIRRVEIASGTCSATNAFKLLGRLLAQLLLIAPEDNFLDGSDELPAL
jgi:hypothetical protein